MRHISERISLLAVGDKSDFDSFMKLDHDKQIFSKYGIDYYGLSYRSLLNNKIPRINTKAIVIFLFFPFDHWNRKIEPKNYKGIYANMSFYTKFVNFFYRVEKNIKHNFPKKEIFFINSPFASAKYRDKLLVRELISRSGISVPRLIECSSAEEAYQHLNNNESLFVKPRFGSMGKGITFLSNDYWQTNFTYRKHKILSRKSDRGWKFKDVTANDEFLRQLLKHDVYIEEAIDSLLLKHNKVDLRIYVFFGKVIYIYPRTNDLDKITTNISQGGKGHPQRYLNKIPLRLINSSKRAALGTAQALGLNFCGIDIIFDKDLKGVYAVDVNVFPGFPKRTIFDLAKHMITQLGDAYTHSGIKIFKQNLAPYICIRPEKSKGRVVVFDYDSRFLPEIERTILRYNFEHPKNKFLLDIYKSKVCSVESEAGRTDIIIHSGGDGRPVVEDISGIPKLYICHSHQWKAIKEGGYLTRLIGYQKGIQFISVLEDDDVLGRKGKMPIAKFSCLAITKAPEIAKILATRVAVDHLGKHIEIIEALKYPDGSVSIQGHPEEGTAHHIIYNLLNKVNLKK